MLKGKLLRLLDCGDSKNSHKYLAIAFSSRIFCLSYGYQIYKEIVVIEKLK